MLPDLRMAFAETIAKTHSHYSFGHETSWKMLEGIQLWRAYANFYGTCETNWNRSGSSESGCGAAAASCRAQLAQFVVRRSVALNVA